MSDQQINVARELVTAFNNNDWDKTRELLPDNTVYDEVGTNRRIEGVGQLIEALQGWKAAMPDAKGNVTAAFAANNQVALEVTWTGTQTGPMPTPTGTLPPSGKQQTTRGAWILNFEGDKVVESRNYFDMLSFLTQIGAM